MDLNLTGAADADLIKDSDEASFMADVVEASQTTPIIVDFWAPWCGPCKTLGPQLEDAVRAAKGAVKMVKVNVDEAQMIAGQLQIQSIPTVYAFWKGQPIDGFQGALPPSDIDKFLQKLVDQAGGEEDNGLADAIAAAEAMLDEGAATDAAETFAAILQEDPNSAAAYAGLVKAHLALDDVEQAEAILNGAPAEISTDPALEAVAAQIALVKEGAKAGPIPELQQQVDADPADHQARFELATAQHVKGQTQEAVDNLLEIFKHDRDWNDGAAKTQLFKIFDALDAKDPIALNGRRKLSSLIFA